MKYRKLTKLSSTTRIVVKRARTSSRNNLVFEFPTASLAIFLRDLCARIVQTEAKRAKSPGVLRAYIPPRKSSIFAEYSRNSQARQIFTHTRAYLFSHWLQLELTSSRRWGGRNFALKRAVFVSDNNVTMKPAFASSPSSSFFRPLSLSFAFA